MQTPPISLCPKTTYIIDNDDDVRLLLFSLGMPGGLPDPTKESDLESGFSFYASQIKTHYVVFWRYPKEEGPGLGRYFGVLLDKKHHKKADAIRISLALCEKVCSGYSYVMPVMQADAALN
jgi:hypothetical protein